MKARTSDLRVVFFGTPRLAVTVLEVLKASGIVPALIVTAPDRPKGRGLVLTPPPVKVWAEAEGVPVIQPQSLKVASEELELLSNSEWDLGIVAAYGKILPQSVLDLPAHGMLNVHPSLLPAFRGPAPIEGQVLADVRTVGVSIMLLDAEVDHGPVLSQARIELDEWPLRARDLEELLATEGGNLLAESIPPYISGELVPIPQNHVEATFTKKIEKSDGELDLSADGYQNYLKYCAYDEWPGTFFFKDGKRIKITEAKYENGQFMLVKVIPEGKKEQDWR
jgi:methionyl-tRNA formyltransferase